MINKILCAIGWHKWKQYSLGNVDLGWFDTQRTVTKCKHCWKIKGDRI